MDLRRFLFFAALGTLVWTGFLAALGFLLGDQSHRVADWTNPVSNVIIAPIVLWYLSRVPTFSLRRRPEDTSSGYRAGVCRLSDRNHNGKKHDFPRIRNGQTH